MSLGTLLRRGTFATTGNDIVIEGFEDSLLRFGNVQAASSGPGTVSIEHVEGDWLDSAASLYHTGEESQLSVGGNVSGFVGGVVLHPRTPIEDYQAILHAPEGYPRV